MTRATQFTIHSVVLMTLILTTSVGAAPPSQTKSSADHSVMESTQQAKPIDINSATLTDLRSLPGVGPVIARKIVAGRPYTSIDDLKIRNVLPITTYDKIRHRISTKATMGTKTSENGDIPGSSSSKQ